MLLPYAVPPSHGFESDVFKGYREFPFHLVYNARSSTKPIVAVSVGKRDFFTQHIAEKIPADPDRYITYIGYPKGSLGTHTMVKYSGLMIASMETVPLQNEVFIDIGSSDGILSLRSAQSGVKETFAVDCNPLCRKMIDEHLLANGMSKDAVSFCCIDITKTAVQRYFPLDRVTVVAANLGPHYGRADLAAIALLKHMPNAHTFIAGGYTVDGPFNPVHAKRELEKQGFTKHTLQLTESCDVWPERMAFVAKRR